MPAHPCVTAVLHTHLHNAHRNIHVGDTIHINYYMLKRNFKSIYLSVFYLVYRFAYSHLFLSLALIAFSPFALKKNVFGNHTNGLTKCFAQPVNDKI